MEASLCYVGLTVKQFEERFECAPAALGLRVQDLPNHKGEYFKGISLRDPDRPYVNYTVKYNLGCEVAETRMGPNNQLYEDQSKKTFKHCKANNVAKKVVERSVHWSYQNSPLS